MANLIKPPTPITAETIKLRPSVMLLGSIEQGNAEQWQVRAEELLKDYDIDVYNPRRLQWDASWEQSIDNPKFKEQVLWELTALENTNVRLFYFDPNTKAPVTLAELGLSVSVGSLDTIVCCPDGYWRKGNVDIICERYGIHQEETLEDAVRDAISRLNMYYDVPRKKIEPPKIEVLEEMASKLIDPLDE